MKQNMNDIIRSKYTEGEHPVDEANWKNMRSMIDESRRKKKVIVWCSLSALILLIGFCTYELALKPAPVQQSNTAASSSAVVATNNNATGTKENTTTQHTTNTNATTITQQTPENTITSSTNPNPVKNSKPITTVAHPTMQPVTSATIKQRSLAYVKPVTPQHQVKPSATVVATTTTYTPAPPQSPPVDEMAVTAEKERKAEEEKTKKEEEQRKQTADSTAKANAVSVKTVQPAENKTATFVKPAVDSSAIAVTTQAQKKPDSSIKVIPQQATTLPPIEGAHMKKDFVSIELGGGYSMGWQYGDTVQGKSVYPIIGISYKHAFDSSWAVKVGLQFSMLGGMQSDPFIIKHVTYDFGFNSNDTMVNTQWLYYITLPFQVERKLGKKNAVGIGGSISYLLTGSGTVDVTNVSGNVQGGSSKFNQLMYVRGYNPLNASVYLLYKRDLTDKLSVYVTPYFGLIDLKSNSFFMRNTFERDSGIKLMVSYNLF